MQLKDNYILLHLNPELKRALQETSRITGLSQSDIITLALVSFLTNPQAAGITGKDKYLH